MTNVLVNSIYPVQYFALPGVDQINYPDNFWWSSKLRFAAVANDGVTYLAQNQGGSLTSEILELDLGRIREINYMNFDVLRAPINVKIEYDLISSPDRDAVWLPVQPVSGLDFDDRMSFDPNNRTSWQNAEYNFMDSKGNMIHTRYVRITFTRRDEGWPVSTSDPFPWPVFVKHLRLGRNITDYLDTVGPLLFQDTPLGLDEIDLETIDNQTTREVRQQFVVPETAVRAGVTPTMLGFGLLIQTADFGSEFSQDVAALDLTVSYAWSIWDVTNSIVPVKLVSGIETGALTPGLSWLDWYLDESQAIVGDTSKVYELRAYSMNPTESVAVFATTPNSLSNTPIPGTLDYTHGSSSVGTSVDTTGTVSIGDYIIRTDISDQPYLVNNVTSSTITLNVAYPGAAASAAPAAIIYPLSLYDDEELAYSPDATRSLVCRVWADIADEGRDVLGNAYRYVTHSQDAAGTQDSDSAGWMSDAFPSPDAVEALYFDVRGTDPETLVPILNVIEAIQIAPRTPGVRMNVYYSQQNLSGTAPVDTNDWDNLLWTPLQQTYVLRRNEVIQLPYAIKASYVKLEFTALNPMPYRLPTYPAPSPKVFRRFPTWVEDQFNNTALNNLITDWFLRNATPVETNVLSTLSDPILEFEYEQQSFLAALALGTITDSQVVNSGLVDVADKALIDPTTASKIYVSFSNQYQNSLLLSVDQDSILGQTVVARFDPTLITDQNEQTAPSFASGAIATVSTTNDRVQESYQSMAQTPMRFNTTCRHVYTIDQALFNKKAYFVGIEAVRFLRNDYTVEYDDPVIPDNLYDDLMLDSNTFELEEATSIPDGATLYVSYSINPDIVDEVITLSGNNPIALSVSGAPARNVYVFSMPNKQGVQYFQDIDFELSYDYDDNGVRQNYIQRSTLGERLSVPLQAIIYVDAGTVIGHAVIPSPPTDDAAVAVSVAVISAAYEGPPIPDYSTGHYGTGTYADLASGGPTDDAATVVSVAVISTSAEGHDGVDAATVVSVAVISAAESKTP